MNATEATRHQQETRRDSQQLAGLQSDAQTDTTTDVVPLIVRGLVRAHRFGALVAAVLITLLLFWVFAHEKIGVPSGPTPLAAHTQTQQTTHSPPSCEAAGVTSAQEFFMHRIIAPLLLTAIRSFSSGMVSATDALNGKARLATASTTVSLQLETGETHEASGREMAFWFDARSSVVKPT